MQDIIKDTILGALLDLWIMGSTWFVGLFPPEIVAVIAWLMTPWAIPVWLLIGAAIGKWGWKAVVAAGVVLWAGITLGKSLRDNEPAGEFGEMESDPHPVPRPRPRRTLRDLFKRN